MSDSTQLADQFLLDSATNPDPVVSVSKDKRVIHCVDNNNGSYQSGVTTIDATSQLNGSTGYGSLRDGYLVVPYVVTAKNTGGSALASVMNRFCIGMKTGIWNIIDSLSVELNGKSIITENDYKCYWNNLRAMSEWSDDDIVKHGADSFLYPDEVSSIQYPMASSLPDNSPRGDGFCNNTTGYANVATGTAVAAGSTFTSASFQTAGLIKELECAINTGFSQRLQVNPITVAYADATGTTLTPGNLPWWPTTRSGGNLTKVQQQASGGFVTTGTAAAAGSFAGAWYHVLKIRLVDLHPIFKELDLIANPQLKLKIRYNTGYVDINTFAGGIMELGGVSLVGSNTVPIMVASAAAGNPMNGVPTSGTTGSLRVAFGVMQNSLTPISTSGQIFPFTTTRLYIPFYDIANQSQIVAKPIQKVHYNDCYAQYFQGKAGTGSTGTSLQNASFSFQLSASLKNIKYVALIPYSETSTQHFKTVANVQQFQSPFDTAPWTCQPGSSVRNFQVQIGNENVFNKTQDYDYETFNDEFRKLGAINGGLSHEISNGLVDLYKWSTAQRIMIADCSRITNPDVPQSVLISGTNNCSQGSNYLVLVVYGRSLSIDRLTGEVAEYE